jgi:hypothetical protein
MDMLFSTKGAEKAFSTFGVFYMLFQIDGWYTDNCVHTDPQ